MSFKDTLAGKRKSPSAIFHKFRTDASIRTRGHIFVEGFEDVSFYSKHISSINGQVPRFHICFGKKNLDKVADLYWLSKIERPLILFIRDSDFDEYLGKLPSGDGMFTTCGYSVENYVCTVETLRQFFLSGFCVDEEEVNVASETETFEELATKLHLWLAPVYGAAFHAISEKRTVDFNKLDVELLSKRIISGENLPEPSMAPGLPLMGLRSSDFNAASLAAGRRFAERSALSWLRGKYVLTALTEYLKSREGHYRDEYKNGTISQFNRKIGGNLSEDIVFERMVGFAHPTLRLVERLGNFTAPDG